MERFKRLGRWIGTLGALAAGTLAVLAPPARAQSVYDGTALDAADKADIIAWSTHFWQRTDQGGGSPGAGFAFSKAQLNDPLFNPLRAARPTLEKVGAIDATACDGMGSEGPLDTSAEAVALRAAFRDAMLEGKIQTDWNTDPGGTIQHANLILATPASAGLTVYVDGTKLVSLDLPLEKVSTPAYQATLAANVGVHSQLVIAALLSSGAQWATDSGSVTETQKFITGQASKADLFAARARQLIGATTTDPSQQASTGAYVISAGFSVYGALPVVVAQLGDCKVLLDPINGNLSGPFALDSVPDATGLLSFHVAIPSDAALAYYTGEGCPIGPVAIWNPGTAPGAPNTPRLPCPSCRIRPLPPGVPTPPSNQYPNPPPWNPGNSGFGSCLCSNGFCTEVDQGTVTGPPAMVYLRIRYYDCNNVPLPISGCPSAAGCTLIRQDTWTP